MKKITYLMAAAALAACSGNPGGYTVSGTVEGAVDGDTVLLQRPERRQLVPIDTAVVEGGRFTFTGRQDSAINVYVTCRSKAVPQGLLMDFFLENGQIDVTLTTGAADAATGTALNDKYQEVRQRVSTYNAQMQALGETYQTDTTLTDEGRQRIVAQYDSLQQKASEIMQQSIEQNSDNLVGVTLLKQVSMNLEPAKLIEIMDKIPAGFDTDAQVAHLRQLAQSLKSTLSGQLFTDLTLATPEGKEVRLSDYVGHGKVVLVDFWASWCGPCRREMPSLVEAYKKFAGKNFEIVGISLDEDAEAWKLAIEKLHITWPQMSDLKGWRSVAASTYAVNSIPHTMLIDADGRILQRGLHGEELLKAIEEALKK